MSNMKCPICGKELKDQWLGQYVAHEYFDCPKCKMNGNPKLWQELIHTRKVLDKCMEHITGLNNMIESWYKLLQSDKDTSTKYAILKSAISAYVENKGGGNE